MPRIFGSSSGGSSGGATGTPSIVIAQATRPTTLNLSTEGTIDWLTPMQGAVSATQLQTHVQTHRKVDGEDDMARTWYMFGGTTETETIYFGTGASTNLALTTNAGDDGANESALSANANEIGIWTPSTTGFGYRFDARATTAQRVLRLYCSVYNGTMTISALLRVTGTTASLVIPSGASTTLPRLITLTYNSSTDYNEMLRVKVAFTTNLGSGNLRFSAATLASS